MTFVCQQRGLYGLRGEIWRGGVQRRGEFEIGPRARRERLGANKHGHRQATAQAAQRARVAPSARVNLPTKRDQSEVSNTAHAAKAAV